MVRPPPPLHRTHPHLEQVLVSDKKYAWYVPPLIAQTPILTPPRSETCIKGHRSSACKHTDRPLFEIKKKGRPVTQCEHCRELRKTKQVHVKCLCGAQDVSTHPLSESSHSKKGATKLPAVAAFPHGLPEDLEAIAILPAVSDGSVESDHSGRLDTPSFDHPHLQY
ncbi:transcription factor [Chiua virens]|nr:transcription factor [Chiua virens]